MLRQILLRLTATPQTNTPRNYLGLSRNKMGLAGRNYKYPHGPHQGDQEKMRRRRQIAKGMLTVN